MKETVNNMDLVVGCINEQMKIFSLNLSVFCGCVSLLEKLSKELDNEQKKIEVDISGDMKTLFEMQETFKHISNITVGYVTDLKKLEKV